MRIGARPMKTPGRFSFASLRWPLVALAVIILFGSMGWGIWSWVQKLNRLIDLGWAAYVGWPQGNLLIFTSACARDTVCRPVLAQAWQQLQTETPWLFLGVTFFSSAIGSAVAATLDQSPGLKKPPGGARWATKADLKSLLRRWPLRTRRGYLGVHGSGRALRPPEPLRCAHTLVIGGTGAGKSTSYYKPNLLMDALDGCSAVVIDLKYPDTQSGLFDMVSVFAKAGHDVQLFLPFDDLTLRLPLLAGAESTIVAAQMTDTLAPLQLRGGDKDFFLKQQRALLSSLILGLAREGTYALAALIDLLQAGTLEVAAYFQGHPDAEVRERIKGFFDQEARIRNGVVTGLLEDLEPFKNERLRRATTPSTNSNENVSLSTLGTRPTLLYIGIPQDELLQARGQVLLQLIKRLLDRTLIQTANAHGGRLPVHTSVYLDEFTSLGALPHVGETFATMRSRRVAYHISLQNRAQGEAVYGATEFRSFINGNIRQTLIFPKYLAHEDAAHFSEVMGQVTAVALTKGTTRKHIFEWPSHLRRQQEVARPLVSVEEMWDWPEGVGILLQSGSPPMKVTLPRLDTPRLLGIKNPLYAVYQKWGPATLEVSQTVRTILAKRRNAAASAQHRLRSLRHQYALPSTPFPPGDTPQDEPKTEEPIQDRPIEARLELPKETAHHELKRWLSDVLERQLPVQVEMASHKKHEVARLVISRAALPEDIQQPEALDTWLARGWVEQSGEAITIQGEGVELVGRGTAKRLHVIHQRRQKAQDQRANRLRVRRALTTFKRDKTPEQLRLWIAAHSRQLDGHPDYDALTDEEKVKVDVLGWYQARTLKLTNETLRKLLGVVPDDLRAVRIDNRQGTELPMQALERFSKLVTWCRDHTHLLVGHPDFETREDKAELEPVGTYQEEAVALPKREYQRILGRLPDETKRRDLTIGHGPQRRKRRLQMYTFEAEAF